MPSEATLQKIENDFTRIARSNHGSPEVLSQYKLGDEAIAYNVRKGKCQGLSIMWLLYRRMPSMGGLFKELLDGAMSTGQRDRLKSITDEMALQQGRATDADDNVGLEREKAAMKSYGMNFVEKRHYGGGWGKGHSDLGKYIFKNPGYYLMDIPGHALASHSGRGLPMFYDPNIGQVTFATGDGMGGFFSQFFKTPTMMTAYAGGGTKIQVTITRYM